VDAIGSTSTAASWAKVLGLDPAEYVGLVHGALEGIGLGPGAEGETIVVVEWSDAGAEVSWADERVVIPAAVVERMVFAPALLEALHDAGPELRTWHEAFSAELRGHDEAKWDAATGDLRLARGVLPWRTFPARRLGSFGLGDGVFRWGWAEPDVAAGLVVSAEELEGLSSAGALRTPWFPCDEAFAVRLSAWAALRLGGRGLYPLPEEAQTLALFQVR
jgi:hypothetical protein